MVEMQNQESDNDSAAEYEEVLNEYRDSDDDSQDYFSAEDNE